MVESMAAFNSGAGFEHSSNMPDGYEKLERVEVYQKADGTEGLRGIITLGEGEAAKEHAITINEEPHELWGFDPEAWQKYTADPEKWELWRRVEKLEKRVRLLEVQNRVLTAAVNGRSDPVEEPSLTPEPEPVSSPAPREPAAEPESPDTPEPEPEPNVTVIRPARPTQPEPVPPTPAARRVVKEETAWYRRQPVAVAVGGLATLAAVVAAGMGIWNHHELEELEHRQPAIERIVPNHDDNDHAGALIPNNGYATPTVLAANGYHLSYYNQAKGRRLTGVWLPKNVNLVGSPGSYRIVKNGKTLVTKAEWDSQGKLTRGNMSQLRKNYNVGWGNLGGNRLVTIVATR